MKQVELKPTAKVSVKKSVLKKYVVDNQDTYFLKDCTEFEIELFNPLQETILCNIIFNGKKTESSGLVLDPGERIFLERYLDSNEKFLFKTYEVEDSEEAKHAITKNGLLRISFHKEKNTWLHNEAWNTYQGPNIRSNEWQDPNIFYCDTSHTTNVSFGMTTTTDTQADWSSTGDSFILNKPDLQTKGIETGRIDKGDLSDQNFVYVNKDFQTVAFHYEEIKLLPDSHRAKTSEDLKVRKYCTQCGKKAKPKDKFCSACGTKL